VNRLKRIGRALWGAFDRFNRHDGWAMAGYIAFSALLSLFPFLIFATTLIGMLIGEARSDQVTEALFQIAPEHVARTLEPVVFEVVENRSGGILTISALFAIFVASNAVEALRSAFDRAYVVPEPRNIFVRRLQSIAIVFLGAVVAALLGFSILLSPLIIQILTQVALIPIPGVAGYLSYGFGLIVFVLFLLYMHRWLPGRRIEDSRVWPGVIVTAILWMAAAGGFSYYLSFAPTYTVTYGGLAGVVITLMFFYLTGLVIIFGAEYNAALAAVPRPPKKPARAVQASGSGSEA
jgi:membrane protein